MRHITKSYALGTVESADGEQAQDKISSGFLTRASLSVVASSTSALSDAQAYLEGSNAVLDDNGVKLQANREPYFTPPESSWFIVPGSAISVSTDGAQSVAVSISYRFLRAVYDPGSTGSAIITLGLDAKSES
jgi:hypothetical protein